MLCAGPFSWGLLDVHVGSYGGGKLKHQQVKLATIHPVSILRIFWLFEPLHAVSLYLPWEVLNWWQQAIEAHATHVLQQLEETIVTLLVWMSLVTMYPLMWL